MVRVLIVDDSPLFLEALRAIFEADSAFEVVGEARDGREAVEKVAALAPDLVAMDVQMPGMDGLEAVDAIMASHPTPILLITGDPARTGAEWCFEALRRGALDLQPKPTLAPEDEEALAAFREHARLLASVPVVYRRRRTRPKGPAREEAGAMLARPMRRCLPELPGVAGLVASTGGPAVLAEVLGALPGDFPLPIAIVQHLAPGFAPHLVHWLDGCSALSVSLATEGAIPRPGHAYLAPDGAHLCFAADGRFHLDRSTAPLDGHRPSGTVLLRSIAEVFGARSVGLVLTGMGSDGAAGLAALRRAGGATLVQDEASSVVYGMPKAALDLGAAEEEIGRSQLAEALLARARALG
ncbi:MAG: chemotaxis-specific protein-glutamate methyltransferase CheB [Deltaproteobacteria bacterium]|nr:MAG: chemotaxis-specific protein-glutamate methyltransferase CheB [Deltaproteobacteria bacterium]